MSCPSPSRLGRELEQGPPGGSDGDTGARPSQQKTPTSGSRNADSPASPKSRNYALTPPGATGENQEPADTVVEEVLLVDTPVEEVVLVDTPIQYARDFQEADSKQFIDQDNTDALPQDLVRWLEQSKDKTEPASEAPEGKEEEARPRAVSQGLKEFLKGYGLNRRLSAPGPLQALYQTESSPTQKVGDRESNEIEAA
eukprot:g7069.t1